MDEQWIDIRDELRETDFEQREEVQDKAREGERSGSLKRTASFYILRD